MKPSGSLHISLVVFMHQTTLFIKYLKYIINESNKINIITKPYKYNISISDITLTPY